MVLSHTSQRPAMDTILAQVYPTKCRRPSLQTSGCLWAFPPWSPILKVLHKPWSPVPKVVTFLRLLNALP